MMMKWLPTSILVSAVFFASLVWAQDAKTSQDNNSQSSSVDTAKALSMIAKTPMSFEVNRGQTDPRVKFLSRGLGYTLFLTGNWAVMALERTNSAGAASSETVPEGKFLSPLAMQELAKRKNAGGTQIANAPKAAREEAILNMRVVGGNAKAALVGVKELEAKTNYYKGSDPSKWLTEVPSYEKVQYTGIYPGIDLVYYGNQQQLEYDFVVSPGANVDRIAVDFSKGADGKGKLPMRVESNGDLVAQLESGAVRFHKPVVYQTSGQDRKTFVDGRYVLQANGKVGFEVGPYDHDRKLVIDPTLSYASYIGGSNKDSGMGVTIGVRFGNVIITGSTRSADFPAVTPFQTFAGGTCGSEPCRDIFLSKFNSFGTSLMYSTFLGGTNDDVPLVVTQDSLGDMFLAGYTLSTDFPVTGSAFQRQFKGGTVTGDGFVVEFASRGAFLAYSTYLGGTGDDQVWGLAVDSTFNAYVSGYTASDDFPTTAGALRTTCPQTAAGTCSTGFVTEVNAKGNGLVYSTFLGGSNGLGDSAYGLALDSSNNAYISGITGSPNFPVTATGYDKKCGTDGLCNGNYDGFMAKLNPTGSALLYSTFLGGSAYDYTSGIAVDALGGVYVSGNTLSSDFPVTANAGQKTYGGASAGCNPLSGAVCGDVTVSKFSRNGALLYSTYLGGSGDEYPGISMAVDGSGNGYLTGQTNSPNFPLVSPFQSQYGGGPSDAFVAKINPNGSFGYSSYLGGNGQDYGYRTALDSAGNVWVVGGTLSTNFPATKGAYQTKCGTDGNCNGGLFDAWLAKVAFSADLSVTVTAPTTVTSGGTLTYTITEKDNGSDPASSVSLTDATPTGTTFNSVSTTGGTCTAPPPGGTGTVTCTVPTQPKGGHIVVTMVVNVTAQPGATITDTANVTSATFDPNQSNNSSTAQTTVQ